MNQSLMGTSIVDVGKNIQKLCRDNKKLERSLKNIGTSSDTELFRVTLKNDIHSTTSLVKLLLTSIQDLKSQEMSNNISPKLQRMEKQFLEQYQILTNITKNIKIKLESNKVSNINKNNKLLNKYDHNTTGTYDLSKLNTNTNNNTNSNTNSIAMDQFSNHPPIPIEENEQNLSQKQAFIPQFDDHLNELEEREEAIYNMVDDLTQLNSMCKDLSGLIDDQGEQIVVLASNVEHARDDVKSGAEHLDVASKHQRKYRKKMCIILLILLALAVVLTAIFYFTN